MFLKKNLFLVFCILALPLTALNAKDHQFFSSTVGKHHGKGMVVSLTELYVQDNKRYQSEMGILVDPENFSLIEILRLDRNKNVTDSFPVNNVNRGITLMRMEGKDIIKIKGHGLDMQSGGTFDLIYLNNGINDRYKAIRLDLRRENFVSNSWGLYTQNGTRIHSMYFTLNKIFGRTIGIKEIIINRKGMVEFDKFKETLKEFFALPNLPLEL